MLINRWQQAIVFTGIYLSDKIGLKEISFLWNKCWFLVENVHVYTRDKR